MAAVLGPLPLEFRQTVTFDNGTEFARHYELHAWGIETFFCDTYSPWQKGGVENAIGRMRWFLPRKTNLASLSQREFTRLLRVYNNTPRKCLDYRTPAEVLQEQVLHFECEFTFLPAQERRGGAQFNMIMIWHELDGSAPAVPHQQAPPHRRRGRVVPSFPHRRESGVRGQRTRCGGCGRGVVMLSAAEASLRQARCTHGRSAVDTGFAGVRKCPSAHRRELPPLLNL